MDTININDILDDLTMQIAQLTKTNAIQRSQIKQLEQQLTKESECSDE